LFPSHRTDDSSPTLARDTFFEPAFLEKQLKQTFGDPNSITEKLTALMESDGFDQMLTAKLEVGVDAVGYRGEGSHGTAIEAASAETRSHSRGRDGLVSDR
jgi:hypothetical protein